MIEVIEYQLLSTPYYPAKDALESSLLSRVAQLNIMTAAKRILSATLAVVAAVVCLMSSTSAFHTPIIQGVRNTRRALLVTKTNTHYNNKSIVSMLPKMINHQQEEQTTPASFAKATSATTTKPLVSTLAALSIFTTLLSTNINNNYNVANAYEESDYASETVTTVVQRLKDTTGNTQETFNVLEDIAKIITEGRGVGGTLTYDGVKLNEGYVADEDTTIYNPGLSLLTESEKERLTSALITNRKASLSSNTWNENNEYAFSFLKQKLDPLHMYELDGYLKILPFWGAALYLGALFVQQNVRGVFPLVYGLCALGVFGPIVVLVANGP